MTESMTATAAAVSPGTPSRNASLLLRTLLRAVMPLTDLVMAITWFVITVTGVSLSVGLLPAFLLGIPVFLGLGWADALAFFDRAGSHAPFSRDRDRGEPGAAPRPP